MGHLYGVKLEFISKSLKKVIRTVTRSNYIAHSEPLLRELNLLSVNGSKIDTIFTQIV